VEAISPSTHNSDSKDQDDLDSHRLPFSPSFKGSHPHFLLLGARPAAGATPDVMNVWQSKADDYSIVQCAMLYGLEPGF